MLQMAKNQKVIRFLYLCISHYEHNPLQQD
jgi:hypothetical protein